MMKKMNVHGLSSAGMMTLLQKTQKCDRVTSRPCSAKEKQRLSSSLWIAVSILLLIGLVSMAGPAAASAPLTYTLESPENFQWNASGEYYEIPDTGKMSNITVRITVPDGYNISGYGVKKWAAELGKASVADYTNLRDSWQGAKNMGSTSEYAMAYAAVSSADLLNDTTCDLIKVTIDGRKIPLNDVEKITIPIEFQSYSKNITDDDGDTDVTLDVVIKILGNSSAVSLNLEYYNGWVKGMNPAKTGVGDYLKDSVTGLNITDPNTEEEYVAKSANHDMGFNTSNAGKVVYKLTGHPTDDCGLYSPKLYSINGAYLNLTRGTIQAYDASGSPLGAASAFNCSLLSKDADGRYVFNSTHFTQPAADHYEITFNGRKLGDVDGNGDVKGLDASEISKKVLGKVLSEEQLFYADFNQDFSVKGTDASEISKKVLGTCKLYWL